MKNLLSIFLLISIVCCGMVYANDYDVNSSENAIGISELQGKTYLTFGHMFIPFVDTFRFEESSTFITGASSSQNYSGSYTQTENGFNAHTEWGPLDNPHISDYEGTSILDIVIFGSITTDFPLEGSDRNGFFFGFLLPFRKAAE